MDQQTPSPPMRPRPRDDWFKSLEPAVKIGAGCGAAGFLFGGATGIIKGWPPGLSATVSALQTFALGTTFSFSRSFVIRAWTVEGRPPPSGFDLVKASAVAGAVSGGIVGAIARGRSNVLPGAFMFALFGGAGQFLLNSRRESKTEQPKENFWKRMSDKSWTPFRVLSNEEYAEMLKEKMLKVDVEIAVIDDKIAALKEEQRKEQAAAASSATST
ncbi:unnamed protein product [Lecanosticta acicola]|uniref:Unnamed protein product n=1 Tax=Lecanosticta acicola TaxID=111012 RepID=A0AAI8YSA0_9PEZI|nr:unnamed protein product [Lecanosticta acicola]